MKTVKKLLVALLAVMMLFTVTGCSGTNGETDSKKVNIVHKSYTEQRLLGQMLGVYLADKGYDTEVTQLGGSLLCFEALTSGSADMYAEYTGTGYTGILKETESIPMDEVYEYVKRVFAEEHGIEWLNPMGFNNTYVLTVSKETADEYNLKTISDLIAVSSEFTIGSSAEFASREDGLLGIVKTYDGLDFADSRIMDQGLLYTALENDEIQVLVAFATEGKIAKFNLVNLEDDLGFFPPYDCTPVVRSEYAEANPEVVAALNELGGMYTDADMQKYNLMVDEGEDPKAVAELMLKDKGLID